MKDIEHINETMVIYIITNNIDNKCYVGQSTRNFKQRYNTRWWKYVDNKYLKNAIAKHGHINFTVRIIEKNIDSIERLDELEAKYIYELNCISPNGYNYTYGGQINRCAGMGDELRDHCAAVKSGGVIYRLLNNKTDKIYEFININRFCETHGLIMPSIFRVLTGKYWYHKTWSLPHDPMRKVEIISPNGDKTVLVNGEIAAFCKRNDLSAGEISAIIHGVRKTTNGWTAKLLYEGRPPKYYNGKKQFITKVAYK